MGVKRKLCKHSKNKDVRLLGGDLAVGNSQLDNGKFGNDMDITDENEIVQQLTQSQVNYVINGETSSSSSSSMEKNSPCDQRQFNDQLRNGNPASADQGNGNPLSTEIYKFTDKGPYAVIIEKQDIDPIHLGLKIKRIPNNQVISITKLGKHKVRVNTGSYYAANKLLTQTHFIGIADHKTYLPINYVTTTGFVKEIPVQYSEQEIYENITSNIPVLKVERMTYWDRENGIAKPSTNVKVNFRATVIPDRIFIAYNPVKVHLFIQRPTLCRKCLSYGHPMKYCKSKKNLCNNCAQTMHESDIPCEAQCAFCIVNVPNDCSHRTSSKDCPTFLYQKEIKKLMTIKRFTFHEAKKEYSKLNPPVTNSKYQLPLPHALSFSQVVTNKQLPTEMLPIKTHKNVQRSSQTQTDVIVKPSLPARTTSPDFNNHLNFILKLVSLYQSSTANGTNNDILLNEIGNALNDYTLKNSLFTLKIHFSFHQNLN